MIQNNKANILGLWQRINARAYCLCVFFFAVFYSRKDYSDTLGEKTRILSILSIIIIALAVILLLFDDKEIEFKKINLKSVDITIICFGVVTFLSCLLSEYRKEAFIGNAGFSVGGYFIILAICIYIWLSRLLCKFKKNNSLNVEIEIFIFIILISSAFQFILCILNSFGLDPLDMHGVIVATNEYLGTMGHVNNLAGYVSMIVSFLSGLMIKKRGKISSIITSFVLSLGWILIFVSRCDGAFIGAAVGQAIFIFICLSDRLYLGALKADLLIISCSALFVDVLTSFMPELNLRLDTIAIVVLHNKLYIILFILCIIIYALEVVKRDSEVDRIVQLINFFYKIFLVLAAIISIAYIISKIDDDWGTNRGFVWRVSIGILQTFNLKELIIGIGPECFSYRSASLFGDAVINKLGKPLANAHCDYLNFLVTVGILGLISYVGIFVSIIHSFIKSFKIQSKYSAERIAVFLAIVGYLGQSWMENQMALTFAILVFFIALYRALIEPELS